MCVALSLSPPLLSVSFCLDLSHSLSLYLSLSHSLLLYISLTPFLSLTHSLHLFLSLSISFTLSLSISLYLIHAFSLYLSHSISATLAVSSFIVSFFFQFNFLYAIINTYTSQTTIINVSIPWLPSLETLFSETSLDHYNHSIS